MSKIKSTPGFSLNGFLVPSNDGEWYKKILYADAKSIIKEKMISSAENFVAIGYYLKQIWEKEQYKEDGYSSIWDCAASEFNLSQSAASRYINICKKFSKDGDSPFLDEKFKNFSRSQLQEMLSIKDESSLEEITPEMTAREIRQKSNNKPSKKAEEISENNETEILDGQMTIEGDFRDFIPTASETEETEPERIPEPESEAISENATISGIGESENDVVDKVIPFTNHIEEKEEEEDIIDSYGIEQIDELISEVKFNENISISTDKIQQRKIILDALEALKIELLK